MRQPFTRHKGDVVRRLEQKSGMTPLGCHSEPAPAAEESVSYGWKFLAGCLFLFGDISQTPEGVFAVAPTRQHLDPQFEVEFPSAHFLDFPPRIGADPL
jgi:hypothetical protein